MIRLVTFDLDDTLWDVRPALHQAENAQWQWLTDHFGGRIWPTDDDTHRAIKRRLLSEVPELKHHISDFRRRFIEELLQAAGISKREANVAAAGAFNAFIAERHQVAVFPHAAEVLTLLAQRYKLGALTNGNADVHKTELGPLFAFAFRAEQVAASKPDPALFAAASSAAGVTPSQMVHIGDHLDHDVAGAQAFGAHAIWFNPDGAKAPARALSVACLTQVPTAIAQLDETA